MSEFQYILFEGGIIALLFAMISNLRDGFAWISETVKAYLTYTVN